MQTLYRSGLTLDAIGQRYQLTRERVRQILAKYGMTRSDGGQAVFMTRLRSARAAAKDTKYLKQFGCDFSTYKAIPRFARLKYRDHKNNSNRRAIQFNFTLSEWWQMWVQSGKWEQRSRTKSGYCMTRINDSGAYEVGNVQIMTISENCRLYALGKLGTKRRPKEEQGVCLMNPGTPKPYLAYFKKKRIGTFATKQEAYAARLEVMKEAA